MTKGTVATAVLATLCASLVTSGCTVVSGGGKSASGRGSDVLRMGTLIEPNTLNPIVGTIVVESRVANLVFDGLVRIDDKGRPVPDLAKEVPSRENGLISADGKTVTYHLAKNARWTDGQPVTGEDVAFTWRAIMNPHNNVGTRIGYDEITRVEPVGPHTVRIHYKEPYSPAIFLFSDQNQGAIVPKHVLDKYSDVNRVPFNESPIGSGPYRLREWRHGDRIIFDANPAYFRGAPKIKHVELRVIPDTNTELTQLRTHEIDAAADFDPNQLASIRSFRDIATTIVSTNGYRHVSFNTRRAPLDNPQLRRALCYAMDPDGIFRKVYLAVGLRAPADQNPGSGWADPTLRYYPHDPKRAGQMLDGLGWRLGSDGVRVKNGQRLSVTIVSVAGAKANQAVEVALQDSWRTIGVDTAIKNFPGTTLFAPAQSGGVVLGGKFDVALFSLYRNPDPNDMSVMGPYGIPPNGLNSSFFADAEVGRLQVDAIHTFDLQQRHKFYDAIQRIIVRDAPIYTLVWVPLIESYDVRVRGVKPSPEGIDFWNVTDWTLGG